MLENLQGPRKKPMATLTPTGREKLEISDPTGTRGDIMWYLKENGPSSVEEIRASLNLSPQKVKDILRTLESESMISRL
jgi:DNA-binding MarR family transcriptional regulator